MGTYYTFVGKHNVKIFFVNKFKQLKYAQLKVWERFQVLEIALWTMNTGMVLVYCPLYGVIVQVK